MHNLKTAMIASAFAAACLGMAAFCGCAPERTGSAAGSEVHSGEAPSPASPAIAEAAIAQWKAKIASIRAQLEVLAGKGEGAATPERLRELADELATLERQIAGAKVVTAAKPVIEAPSAPSEDASFAPAAGESPLPLQANHPFAPAIRRAKQGLARFDDIKDYTAVIAKRERMKADGKLNDYEYMYAKIRHEPFSVYLRFLGPENLRGREVIYVAGRNDGRLLAHEPKRGVIGFLANRVLKTLALPPDSNLAMLGNRYTIRDIGMKNLTERLIAEGEKDMRHREADAKFYPNASVNGRPCEAYVFEHRQRRDYFKFSRAEVYIDKEYGVPIRYSSWDWPKEGETVAPLLEEYTYTKLKLNVGLTDKDFDPTNPEYEFPQ